MHLESDDFSTFTTKHHTLGWTLFHLHFHDNYHHDFLKKLNGIINNGESSALKV